MDCSSITDFQQSTAISIAKKFRNLHIGLRENGIGSTHSMQPKSTQKCEGVFNNSAFVLRPKAQWPTG